MKNYLRNALKKSKKAAANMPRPLDEIRKEYAQLCATLGEAQYLINQKQLEVQHLAKELQRVNQEAAARQQLDAAANQKTPVPAEKAE